MRTSYAIFWRPARPYGRTGSPPLLSPAASSSNLYISPAPNWSRLAWRSLACRYSSLTFQARLLCPKYPIRKALVAPFQRRMCWVSPLRAVSKLAAEASYVSVSSKQCGRPEASEDCPGFGLEDSAGCKQVSSSSKVSITYNEGAAVWLHREAMPSVKMHPNTQ